MSDFVGYSFAFALIAGFVLVDVTLVVGIRFKLHKMWLERESLAIERLWLELELAHLGGRQREEQVSDES